MAQLKIHADAPDDLSPHLVELDGQYQSDPGDLAEGVDWRTARWELAVHFVPVAPWTSVNRIIRSVGVSGEGNIIIAGGVDVSSFLIDNAVEADQPKLRSLFNDQHRVITRKTIFEVTMFLVEQWSGGKASIVSAT